MQGKVLRCFGSCERGGKGMKGRRCATGFGRAQPDAIADSCSHAVRDAGPDAIAHSEPAAGAYARPDAGADAWPHTEVRR